MSRSPEEQARGFLSSSLENFESAQRIREKSPDLASDCARIMDRLYEAGEDLANAERLHPDATIEHKGRPLTPQQIAVMLLKMQAEVQTSSGMPEEYIHKGIGAIDKLMQIPAQARNVDTLNLATKAHLRIGDTERAEGFNAKALRMEPENNRSRQIRDEIYRAQGSVKNVIERPSNYEEPKTSSDWNVPWWGWAIIVICGALMLQAYVSTRNGPWSRYYDQQEKQYRWHNEETGEDRPAGPTGALN